MNLKLLETPWLKLHQELVTKLDAIAYPDADRISKEILEFITEKDPEIPVAKAQTQVSKIIARLTENEPWEYVRGWAEFCGSKFFVDSNVLIPRLETEDLVNYAVADILKFYSDTKSKFTIVDAGTGSGCIILSIEARLRDTNPMLADNTRFIATDISEKALKVAGKNAKSLDSQVMFIKTNLIEGLDINRSENVFIVANLPYIPTRFCEQLDKSVIDYEPRLALDGGETGTMYYDELLKQLDVAKIKPVEMLFEADENTIINHLHAEYLRDFTGKNRFVRILER